MNENWEHKVTCAHNKYVEQYHLGQYNCTMEDYGELVIQFGYLVLFSVAFPPASVVILLNNIVEVRSDSFKILALSQRVNADDAASIGAWYAILEFLNILAVATNVGLLIFTTDSLDVLFGLERRLGEDEGRKMLVRVVVFFSLEHALLGMKALLAAVVNDVPKAAYRNMARQTFEIARWFDQGWRDAFRGGSLLQVDERQVQLCANYAHVFDVASDED